MKRSLATATLAMLALGATAACGGGPATPATPQTATGPIKVWLSNNPEEIAWGEQMVEAWNAEHPDEKVTAQEIPAGKTSEEVIGAAITAGNAPCLVFNTAPAAVPQFQKQGGLVALDDFDGGDAYVEARSGDAAEQYKSPDGQYYQIPWKSNPVMIFYNKDLIKKAGRRPGEPAAGDVRRVPRDQPEDRRQRRRRGRDLAGAVQRVLPVLVRLLPAVRRRVRWQAAGRGRQGDVRLRGRHGRRRLLGHDVRRAALAAGDVQRRLVRRREGRDGDRRAVGDRGLRRVGQLGRVPVPTAAGKAAEEIYTFSDAKNIGLYSACENQGTAWEVLKFATSEEQDGKLLELTGQMPLRTDLPATYPDYFKENPEYEQFADQASAHRRGAERAELDRDLAELPRRVVLGGDLRQDLGRRRAEHGGRQGNRARRPVVRPACRR